MQFNGNFSVEEKDLIYRWIVDCCLANNIKSDWFDEGISISFNSRKKRILALAYSRSKRIEISSFFWERATLIQKEETVKHEACHLIAYFLFGPEAIGHGKFFKQCMRKCGLTPEAYVKSSDYSNVVFKGWRQRRYAATCSCGYTIEVSGRVRANIIRGGAYRCFACHGLIDLV